MERGERNGERIGERRGEERGTGERKGERRGEEIGMGEEWRCEGREEDIISYAHLHRNHTIIHHSTLLFSLSFLHFFFSLFILLFLFQGH